jgi:hypothetical protein
MQRREYAIDCDFRPYGGEYFFVTLLPSEE